MTNRGNKGAAVRFWYSFWDKYEYHIVLEPIFLYRHGYNFFYELQGTGSNGNAGPVNAAGFAVDPAAETYKKQIVSTIKPNFIRNKLNFFHII